MPSRPEQLTSQEACNLTSREFDRDSNIDRDDESGSYHLREHEDADYKRLSGTDSSTTEGLTSCSSSSGDSSDSEDSVDLREHVMVKGLETIAEEDRFTPSSLRSSRKGNFVEWCFTISMKSTVSFLPKQPKQLHQLSIDEYVPVISKIRVKDYQGLHAIILFLRRPLLP